MIIDKHQSAMWFFARIRTFSREPPACDLVVFLCYPQISCKFVTLQLTSTSPTSRASCCVSDLPSVLPETRNHRGCPCSPLYLAISLLPLPKLQTIQWSGMVWPAQSLGGNTDDIPPLLSQILHFPIPPRSSWGAATIVGAFLNFDGHWFRAFYFRS